MRWLTRSPLRCFLKGAASLKPALSASRKMHLKTIILSLAKEQLDQEEKDRATEKERTLAERVPDLELTGLSLQELQDLCRELNSKIDVTDEERYDTEAKAGKHAKEVLDLNQKIFDLRGKFKRPPLRRVRMSADAMLRALLGSKHKVSMDLRANLKSVKKEEKEDKTQDIGDWRKNVAAMSGMEGRKKMFDTAPQPQS
uniref:troponin I, slow skeletal muscle-like isoform X2 n=1 Tax=Myxine glutinosa TaxID=7769 RepID=UPI00358EC505